MMKILHAMETFLPYMHGSFIFIARDIYQSMNFAFIQTKYIYFDTSFFNWVVLETLFCNNFFYQ